MLNLKKTAVAVLAFGSSAVFAGTMGPTCAPGNVTVPCEKAAWDFGVQALYLKPTYNNGVASFDVKGSRTTTSYLDNDADWNWGFKLEGSYHFGTGNDLTVNWSHLSDDSTTNVGFASQKSAAGTIISGTDSFTLTPKWDSVNVEFGQHVDFSDVSKVRLHAGVEYARINTDIVHASNAAAYINGTTATPTTYRLSSAAKYNGFGPRIGADYSYELGNGLAVYAKGASSILAGSSKVSTYANSSNADARTDFGLPFNYSASKTVLVPEVEAKLGLTYNWAVAQGDLALDVGYMWVNYFNAQQSAYSADSNFGLNGPFAGLKWVGTVV